MRSVSIFGFQEELEGNFGEAKESREVSLASTSTNPPFIHFVGIFIKCPLDI